jgi:putative transcriptional regulator
MKNRIAEIRGRMITQQELADKIGIGRTYLSDIENGKNEPGGKLMLKISEALGLPVEEIFFIDDVSYMKHINKSA